MPACEGRPDGPCLDNRNDNTVRFTQGDLFLCDARNKFRLPVNDRRQAAAGSRKIIETRGNPTVASDASAESRQKATSDSRSSEARDLTLPKVSDATVEVSPAASTAPHLIVDELLSYVGFYREKSSVDAMRRSVLNFYSPSDSCQSKRTLIGQLSSQLASCAFVAERRNSTARAAHEAEIDDILNTFDVLDLQNILVDRKFVTSNLDNLPKYGPEESQSVTNH